MVGSYPEPGLERSYGCEVWEGGVRGGLFIPAILAQLSRDTIGLFVTWLKWLTRLHSQTVMSFVIFYLFFWWDIEPFC